MGHGWMGCLKKIAGRNDRQPGRTDGLLASFMKSSTMTQVFQPAHTLRLKPDPEDGEPASKACPAAAPRSVNWHGVTDRGLVREQNEDYFLLLDLGDRKLLAAADGMGGHDAGEVASRIALDSVCSVVRQESRGIGDELLLVERAVQEANRAVRNEGARRGSDMGTTVSIALIVDDQAYVANVGDSRVYWIENGSISQITVDHSLVAKLVEAGKVSKEEARNHPRANLLYRTIGSDESVKVDTFRVQLKKGGALLLCTDGLWGEVPDEDIHRVFAGEREAAAACTRLVTRAKASGGRDNITAVAIKIE